VPRITIGRDPRSAEGQRRQETVARVIDRATRLANRHRGWSVDSSGSDYILTVSDSGAVLTNPTRRIRGRSVKYDGVVPGSAAKQFADKYDRWLDEYAERERRSQEAERQAQAYQVRVQTLFRAIEVLVHDLDIAIDENEDLRSRLTEARIEIDFLRRQLDQLSEAMKTSRPRIVKSMLMGVGAILLALTTGVGEAGGGRILDKVDAPAATTAEQFLERCDNLVDQLDSLEIHDAGDPKRVASPSR
jgi:hypothetical protein